MLVVEKYGGICIKSQRKSDKISRTIFNVLSLIVVIIYYFQKSVCEIGSLDYVAINGTFQNYNVIRRFLDGQIPFVDYTVYLGIGHLMITSVTTAILGGNYAASVIAYNFISSLSVALLCYGLCSALIPDNWLVPAAMSLYIRYFCPTNIFYNVLHGGNSARSIRALILPICIVLYVFTSRYIESRRQWGKFQKEFIHILMLSFLSGLAFVWGNDYGIVCCIAIYIMVLLLTLVCYHNIIKCVKIMGILLAGTCFTILLISSLVTQGHFGAWLKNNFSTSDFQSWYFNKPEEHIFYYYELDLSLPVIYCVIMFAIYLMLLLKEINWHNIRKYGVVAFSMLACFGTVEEYKLFGGGGDVFHDFLVTVMQIVVFTELNKLILEVVKNIFNFRMRNIFYQLSNITAICYISLVILNSISYTPKYMEGNGKYYERLGGELFGCAIDLDKALNIVENNKVFSDYASALEVVTNQYQPTGTDYIIHCLSDQSRKQYLDVFNKGFDYVSTIKMNYSPYSTWIRNANWFFYREVYEKYHIVDSNGYADYWMSGVDSDGIYTGNITADIQQISETNCRITIKTSEIIDGIADVYLDYRSDVKKDQSSFLLKQNIVGVFPEVRHGGVDDWCLRPISREYIPVEIKDGEGSVNIVSYPGKSTMLTINDANCTRVFRTY